MQEVNSVRVVIIIRILWSTFSQRHCTRGGEVQLKRMADIIMSKGQCSWLNIIISVYVVRTDTENSITLTRTKVMRNIHCANILDGGVHAGVLHVILHPLQMMLGPCLSLVIHVCLECECKTAAVGFASVIRIACWH